MTCFLFDQQGSLIFRGQHGFRSDKKVNDIKQLNEEELAELQEEIRDFLVENIAKPEDIWHRIWV